MTRHSDPVEVLNSYRNKEGWSTTDNPFTTPPPHTVSETPEEGKGPTSTGTERFPGLLFLVFYVLCFSRFYSLIVTTLTLDGRRTAQVNTLGQ